MGRGVPGRPALRAQRELEPWLFVQEPDLAGEMGLQRRVSDRGPAPHRHPSSAPGDLVLGCRLQGSAQDLDRRGPAIHRLCQYLALRHQGHRRRPGLAERLRRGGGCPVPGDGSIHAPLRLPLQHQPDPPGNDAVQCPGAGDRHEHFHSGCFVPGDRERHGLARLDAQLPQLGRGADPPAPWLIGSARCPARHDLGRREHQVRRFRSARVPRKRRIRARAISRRRRPGAFPTSRHLPAPARSRARRPARTETTACRRFLSPVLPRPRRRLLELSPEILGLVVRKTVCMPLRLGGVFRCARAANQGIPGRDGWLRTDGARHQTCDESRPIR